MGISINSTTTQCYTSQAAPPPPTDREILALSFVELLEANLFLKRLAWGLGALSIILLLALIYMATR